MLITDLNYSILFWLVSHMKILWTLIKVVGYILTPVPFTYFKKNKKNTIYGINQKQYKNKKNTIYGINQKQYKK